MQRLLNLDATTRPTISVAGGRSITCDQNGLADVSEGDLAPLAANRWIPLGGVGTTAQRPAQPMPGQRYIDVTIGADVVYDGRGNWRSVVTGSVV